MTKCVSVKMHTDDKVDNRSNNSAASSDSGVIVDENLMQNSDQSNVDISTTITCDNSDVAAVNIENLLNLAKNVCPNRKKSPASDRAASKSPSITPLPKKVSPTLSIRSTNISITSLQSDAVSSVIDSDSDEFEDSNGNYTIKKLGQQTEFKSRDADFPHVGGGDGLVLLQQRIESDHLGTVAALPSPMSSSALAVPSAPQLGNVAFTNSTDITIGQKNYYQGPVTIQQFLIENRKHDGVPTTDGVDNPTFQGHPSPAGEGRKPTDNDILKSNGVRPQPYKFIFNRRAAIITGVIIALTIALAVVFVTSSAVVKRKSKITMTDEDRRTNVPAKTNIGADNIGGGKYLRIVPRNDWLAEPASEALTKLELPVHRIVISHTASENCVSQATCAPLTKSIQYFHKYSRGYSDIAYNFLIGGDGCVYEGRGWDDQGAHTKGYNVDSVGIAFIGTFTQDAPPQKQLNAAKLLIDEGVRLKKIVTDYKLYGARQLVSTESPGEALYAKIKTWPNWSNEI